MEDGRTIFQGCQLARAEPDMGRFDNQPSLEEVINEVIYKVLPH